ncbi:hypothetical protein [Alistipes sp. An66]|uniref:hypothetical protein n=1 Tax=Alistipes sp. An66 TaxID=1965650 RepID=UPI000B391064|nr:hypothetical protein [Alistipes sp. An66]OUN58693.1 hypothetical protein B5G16_07580 [Alistipes sp. An66]
MDWNTIQEELRRLTTLVDGWSQRNEIPAVERDLALEKLRNLYETVRFAESGRAEMPAETDPEAELLPESLDLGAVLSLDGFPDPDEPAGPVSADPAVPPIVPAAPVFPAAEPLDEAPLAAEPIIAEPEVVPVAEPEPVPAEPVAAPESAPIPEPVAETPVPAEPVAAPESAPIPEPVSAGPVTGSEPASEPVAEPAPESAAESPAAEGAAPEKPRPHAAPTLFGLEDEAVVRHRHKQRVIMSLYDPNPEVETISVRQTSSAPSVPAPAADARPSEQPREEEPETVFEEINVETVAGPDPGLDAPEPAVEPVPEPNVGPAAEPDAAENAAPAPATDGVPAPQAAAESPAAEPSATPAIPEPADGSEGAEEVPTLKIRQEPGLTNSPGGAVLGEVINHDVQTLADTIAPPRDVASELLRNEPVTDLRKAIGLNDKFLLIRDLFDGDGEAYERAIGTLNDCGDLDDCMIYIAEHYAWNPNSDGAKLLMDLLERKFA